MWGIEWHPLGSVRVGVLEEIVGRNRLMFVEGRPVEWVLVDLADDYAGARVKMLEIKRIKRGLKHEGNSELVAENAAAGGGAEQQDSDG